MAIMHTGSAMGALGRLLTTGTATALAEAELLERFVSQEDPAAFEVILQRHGPMVLRVCRRILDDPNDVDDAFQATFLILVKKARSIREREVLGTWLYGVARRVAVRLASMLAEGIRANDPTRKRLPWKNIATTMWRRASCESSSTTSWSGCRIDTAARLSSAISKARRTSRQRPSFAVPWEP